MQKIKLVFNRWNPDNIRLFSFKFFCLADKLGDEEILKNYDIRTRKNCVYIRVNEKYILPITLIIYTLQKSFDFRKMEY